MGGKPIIPIFVIVVNPNTALAVEKVIFFAISVAIGYKCFMCLVSTIIFVSSGLNPIAITSKIFS